MLITNAKIITMSDLRPFGGIIENGFIKISNGKIFDIGKMSDLTLADVNSENSVENMSGCTILPGFIDAHTHLGLCRAGETYSDSDINRSSDISPQHSPIQSAVMDSYFDEAVRSGVTTAAISFGSASPMPGKISVVKTYSNNKMVKIVKEYAAQKFAMGENPCTALGGLDAAKSIRKELKLAKEHLSGIRNDYDEIKAEALKPLFNREIPAHIHLHTKEDIISALKIAEEFDIKIVLLHATEGHMLPRLLKRYDIPVIYGPIINDKSKKELINMDESCPAVLNEFGVLTALCTDHPETPAKYLQLCASIAVRNRMERIEALRAITINAAKILGISCSTGSLEKGKEADIIAFRGDPIDITLTPETVICGGERIKL